MCADSQVTRPPLVRIGKPPPSLFLSFLGLGSHFDDFACLFSPPLLTPDTTHYHHRHRCRAAEAEAPALSSSLSARKTGEKEEEEERRPRPQLLKGVNYSNQVSLLLLLFSR